MRTVPVIFDDGAYRSCMPPALGDTVRWQLFWNAPFAQWWSQLEPEWSADRAALRHHPLNATEAHIDPSLRSWVTGTVVERLTPDRDPAGDLTISAKPHVYLALSYDHRIVDGADAARYLGDVKRRLERVYNQENLT